MVKMGGMDIALRLAGRTSRGGRTGFTLGANEMLGVIKMIKYWTGPPGTSTPWCRISPRHTDMAFTPSHRSSGA